MAAEMTLEQLVPEIQDKIGILIFRWGLNASSPSDYIHAQRNFQPAWTSQGFRMVVSELHKREPLYLHDWEFKERCESLLIYGKYIAGTHRYPFKYETVDRVVEEVPPEQIGVLKRVYNALAGKTETRIKKTSRIVKGEETMVIPTLDQVITVADGPENPCVLFYSHYYDYGRGPISSNNFIVTGKETCDKLVEFCRKHPEQVSELYKALSKAKIGFGGNHGKMGFTTLRNWQEKKTVEEVYDLDNKTWVSGTLKL